MTPSNSHSLVSMPFIIPSQDSRQNLWLWWDTKPMRKLHLSWFMSMSPASVSPQGQGHKIQACGTRSVKAKGECWPLPFPASCSGWALGPGPSTSISSIWRPGAHPSGGHFSTELELPFPPALLDGQWRSLLLCPHRVSLLSTSHWEMWGLIAHLQRFITMFYSEYLLSVFEAVGRNFILKYLRSIMSLFTKDKLRLWEVSQPAQRDHTGFKRSCGHD